MQLDSRLIGFGAGVLAAVLIVFMPVNKRRVNQMVVSVVIAILIFVAALAFLEAQLALPLALAISVVVIAARFIIGFAQSAIYRNITRYTRRDYWQRRLGQALIGSGRRRRRDDY